MPIIKTNLVDLELRSIYTAAVMVEDGAIVSITPIDEAVEGYMLPGFIDAHVHIESSLLIPSEFARLAVVHGTVATISDPHEIANVMGMEGIEFMLSNGRQTPFKFFFGAPSCVPATKYETAGAEISAKDIDYLMQKEEICYLAEMMNFPGVIQDDEEVLKKIAVAKHYNKPIDGHAPALRGELLRKYFAAGISTDHECFTLDEAIEKLELGMHVLIREGSAARNFDALIPAIATYPKQIMFCSDDKHPDSLLEGHINALCARAVALGYDVFDILRAACINPVKHYNLSVGTLKLGDSADFILVEDLVNFKTTHTYINGEAVYECGQVNLPSVDVEPINHFVREPLLLKDLAYNPSQQECVIGCHDGQLITRKVVCTPEEIGLANDVLKIAVVNRYSNASVAIAYIQNTGLKRGAIASSVAHDSHNLAAVGVDDESLLKALNLLIDQKGGLCAITSDQSHVLPLPVAGLMSNGDAHRVAQAYIDVDRFSKESLGSTLQAPFMTLSFMSLLVIPSIKLSDKGLFDSESFSFIR